MRCSLSNEDNSDDRRGRQHCAPAAQRNFLCDKRINHRSLMVSLAREFERMPLVFMPHPGHTRPRPSLEPSRRPWELHVLPHRQTRVAFKTQSTCHRYKISDSRYSFLFWGSPTSTISVRTFQFTMSDDYDHHVDENTPLLHGQTNAQYNNGLVKELQDERDDFPDGGRKAWSVVFGSWCAMVAAFGLLNTMGVMHAWLNSHRLQDHSYAQIGWIFSTFTFLVYFGSIQIGMSTTSMISFHR